MGITNLKFAVIAMASTMTVVHATCVDDAAIKACLAKSARYLHSDMAEYVQVSALEECDFDTNRFLRLVKEVALAEPDCNRMMLRLVGKYGSSNDIDFVAIYLTSGKVGRTAVESYYHIVGPTSNLVIAATSYFDVGTPASESDKCTEAEWLMRYFNSNEVGLELKLLLYDAVVDFAMTVTNSCREIDRQILWYYPSYSNSVERLTILTNAVARGVSEYELRYLTNAIHHIELP